MDEVDKTLESFGFLNYKWVCYFALRSAPYLARWRCWGSEFDSNAWYVLLTCEARDFYLCQWGSHWMMFNEHPWHDLRSILNRMDMETNLCHRFQWVKLIRLFNKATILLLFLFVYVICSIASKVGEMMVFFCCFNVPVWICISCYIV